HLLDLLSEMNSCGPSSDSDTSLDDLSDFDEEDDDDVKEDGQVGQRHARSNIRRTDPANKTTLTGRSRKDNSGNSASQLQENVSMSSRSGEGNEFGTQANYRQNTSTSSSQPIKLGPTVRRERPEGAPKQTRKATASKRADRGRPRAVVPLPTNEDGTLNYPIVVGKGTNEVIIENMDTSKKTYFINEILDGGEQPIFQITLEDMPDKVFQHTSSSGAWELALKGLMELGYNAKTHASGPDMYGLTNLGVIKYIQEMPNAQRCRRYMPLKWIIEEEDVMSPHSSNGDPAKSPGRKKRINNSLYASNHEVLMETMEEEAKQKSPVASKPYTPRKYNKRKTNAENDMSLFAPAPLNLLSESEPMEDVKHEFDHSNRTPTLASSPTTPVTPMVSVTAASSVLTTPRSLGGQESPYTNFSTMQEPMRNKESFHHYNPFGQSRLEP
ncbi:choline dehydrogenase 7, partial [Entomortierella beljakovae]